MGKIKTYWLAVKSFTNRNPWWTALVFLIIALGGWWYYFGSANEEEINFAVVVRGTVAQTVSVTGTVKPAAVVDLSFEKSGKIVSVYHNVGDRVAAGEALVAESNADLRADLAQAKASLKTEQAKLSELQSGTREEDINVSLVAVLNAKNDVVNEIKNSYVNTDDAIRNKVDQLFSNPRSFTPQLNVVATDTQLKRDVENGRPDLESMLMAWNSSISSLNNSQDVVKYADEAKTNLSLAQTYLGKVSLVVNSLTPNTSLTQATIDGYKTDISSARANVTSVLDSLSAAVEKLNNALSALALKEAGTVPDQISAQEAVVEGAEAKVMRTEADLNKTVLRSPITGIVTKQDAKLGEIAGAATPIVSVISEARYQIEANVPESDIAKIKIGDSADITLDAYGSDIVFPAVITKIDPAETIIDGIATYKTTLQFKENDSRVKSGMTANTDIYGEKHSSVLFVPGRAISVKGLVKTVQLIKGDNTVETIITTGLRGSNGDVEILSGLKEGDKIKIN